MHADEVKLGHEAGHTLAPDPGADPTELAMDAWSAIGAPRTPVDVADGVGQIGIIDAAR
jgi:hypothetical protein